MFTIELEKLFSGDIRTISRAISLVENGQEGAEDLLDQIYGRLGNAYRIGVTGPPGGGKSTLVDRLVSLYREADKTVGVISIDPTSPFTGGALLGDRIRMGRHTGDSGVYIRSMATRGSLGGLSVRAQEAGDILDAAGKDLIIFETVGVGQVELDIADTADTTLVVLVPESGDEVQAMKSGLMEIADIFVLNKSDREGADRAYVELSSILELNSHEESEWIVNILKTSALNSEGIAELKDEIQRHYEHLSSDGELRSKRQRRYQHRVQEVVRYRLDEIFWTEERKQILRNAIEQIDSNVKSPYALARQLIETLAS